MASTRLSNTMGTPTLGTKFTYSVWVKRSSFGAVQTIANMWADSSNLIELRFDLQDNLSFYAVNSSSYVFELETHDVFKDVSAWYHIVAKVDTTQGTSSNRCKLYVNGVESTNLSTSDYPSQNLTFSANASGNTHYVGAKGDASAYFNGLITHAHFTDGNAYDASSFGESDSVSGIWKPKTAPSVTYGTNGFFLKFENSGNLDLDSSGNSRSFSTSGTLTQNVDTPTNNFATGNPIHVDGTGVSEFINGNLTHTNNVSAVSSLAINKGKWYMEFKRQDNGGSITNWMYCGFVKADRTGLRLYRSSNGDYYNGSAYSSYGASWGDGDIVGIALDYDNDTIEFYKNGLSQGSKTSIGICNGDFVLPIWQCSKSSGSPYFHANFGQGYFGTTAVASANADANGHGAMENAVPSGYYTLNTKNIKEFG